ncbi:MAG: hypothetical protein DHS20C01_22040 [marine bacterium B5-7]|nr:MAG: hypothetical protein DHS20C01_22040 [marine bacterium B5-7]
MRKLTTILAADVVNYSQMMAANEEETLKTLKSFREQAEALINKHNARIFNTAGDAFLAEFGSPVQAVRCAISLQEDFRARNTQLPEEVQMWFRMGINVGDVLVEGNDLYGDGVNVAARLEGLAEKGGICISGSTFDQVKNKLSITFDDIGEQKVKNIPEPVPAFRLVPGQVKVTDTGTDSKSPSHRLSSGRNIILAGAALLLVVATGLYFLNLSPVAPIFKYPFDGLWKVSLSNLSGCLNNNARTFSINVINGTINEPGHPQPKTGSVSQNGEFIITVTDGSGNFRATQKGTLSGKYGEGILQGKKPDCSGKISLQKQD